MVKRYLMHDRLLVRFGALLGMVFIVLLGAWAVSYLLLPEGLLRGRTAAQVLAGNDLAGGSVWLEWLRLLTVNLGIMLLVMIAPNILRTEGDYPLGYSTVTLIAAVFGVILVLQRGMSKTPEQQDGLNTRRSDRLSLSL